MPRKEPAERAFGAFSLFTVLYLKGPESTGYSTGYAALFRVSNQALLWGLRRGVVSCLLGIMRWLSNRNYLANIK